MILLSFQVSFSQLFTDVAIQSAQSSSLNLIHNNDKHIDLSSSVQVSPMEIQAYKVKLR